MRDHSHLAFPYPAIRISNDDYVDDFFETLISEIIKLNKIKISSFGSFSVLNKEERVGRNPKTKVETKIFSRKVVKFKPSLLIKKKINSND